MAPASVNAGGFPTGRPRPGDWLTIAYLAATGIFAAASWTRTGVLLAGAHLAGVAVILWVARVVGRPTHRGASFVRFVYPIALTPLLYLELATLNQLFVNGYFDLVVQHWEELVFGVQLSVEASRWFPSLWLSELLHLGYLSYYFIVAGSLVIIFFLRGQEGLERIVFTVALAFFVCYLCFAAFPVAGPRYAFPSIEGPPSKGLVFHWVHIVLASGSSKGTAFPSSHVAAAVTTWLAARRESRTWGRVVALPTVVLVLGTVYGRFHYGVDALAGLLVAAACVAAAPWLMRLLAGEAASRPEMDEATLSLTRASKG